VIRALSRHPSDIALPLSPSTRNPPPLLPHLLFIFSSSFAWLTVLELSFTPSKPALSIISFQVAQPSADHQYEDAVGHPKKRLRC
jgi:hypothetical protein